MMPRRFFSVAAAFGFGALPDADPQTIIELQRSRLLRAATMVVKCVFVLAVIAAIAAGTANGGQAASSQEVLSLISKALSNKPPLSGPGQSSSETHGARLRLDFEVPTAQKQGKFSRFAGQHAAC